MSDHQIFSTTIEKNGYRYYVVPKGYPLFKALKTFRNPNDISLTLSPNKPYFFGLKNNDPDYIRDYEEEYGVIFEYVTTQPIELLALDDQRTMNKLYKEAPQDIQKVLEKNYGLNTKSRLSEAEPDRIFSNYLCSIGETGYAIYEMETDFGGKFHPELLICNASEYVQYIGQITISSLRIQEIVEMGKMKQMKSNLEQSRKDAKKKGSQRLFEQEFNNLNSFKANRNLFDDFSDEEDIIYKKNGGAKKKKTNKRIKKKSFKTKKNKRKRTFKRVKN
jgi:hypothetical protein